MGPLPLSTAQKVIDAAVVKADEIGQSMYVAVVGVGVRGEVCVWPARLPEPLSELFSGVNGCAAVARMLGRNAARIVVGVPLKPND